MEKKKIIIAISCVLIVLVIAYSYINNSIKQSNDAFARVQVLKLKEDSNTFVLNVLYNASDLEEVGNTILNYWYDTIWEDKFDDINIAVETALNDNEEVLQVIILKHENIIEDYKVLMDYDKDLDDEISDIQNGVKNIYESYYNFYNVVTNPSGNYSDFRNNFSQAISDLNNKVDTNLYLFE